MYYRDDPDCYDPTEGGECIPLANKELWNLTEDEIEVRNLTEEEIFDFIPWLIQSSVFNRDQFDAFVGFCEEFSVELQSKIDAEAISPSLDATVNQLVGALQNTADVVLSGVGVAKRRMSIHPDEPATVESDSQQLF